MSSDRRRFVLSLAAATALAACGFTPAYGPKGTVQGLQGRVLLKDPETREAYLMVQRLEERLGRTSAPAYALDVSTETAAVGLGTSRTGQTTRFNLTGRATYALTDIGTGALLTSGTVETFTGYSASGSTVATLAAERDAQERLMTILADQIVDRLILAAKDLPA